MFSSTLINIEATTLPTGTTEGLIHLTAYRNSTNNCIVILIMNFQKVKTKKEADKYLHEKFMLLDK